MARKIKSVVAWGCVDRDNKICPGWLFPTKELLMRELTGNTFGMRPIKVRVSKYRKRKKKS